ncbi:MAG: hypothetical protein VB022_03205 [Rikenellaceae bacterium]|nr:hypothetical protein [Rikenellaceae bacterium]
MQYNRKYNFSISIPYLILLFVFMSTTAWILPVENIHRWVPLMAGFVDIEDIPLLDSHIIAALFLIISSVSLYAFNERYIMTGRVSVTLPLVFLTLALSSPFSLIFSGTSVATLFLLWSLYYTLNQKKNDQNSFLSVFLATTSALFEPLSVFMIPAIMFFSLRDTTVSLRKIVLIILALIIPFIFIISLRFIFFDDALIFAEEYLTHLKFGAVLEPNVRSVSNILFLIVFIVLLLVSIMDIYRRINSFKIVKSASFVRFTTMIVFLAVLVILYPDSSGWLMQIVSVPAAVLIVESTGENEDSHKRKLSFLLMTIFMVLGRIACFI